MEQTRALKDFQNEEEEISPLSTLLAGADGFDSEDDDDTEMPGIGNTPDEANDQLNNGPFTSEPNESLDAATNLNEEEDVEDDASPTDDDDAIDADEEYDEADYGEYEDEGEEYEDEDVDPIDSPIFTFVEVNSEHPFAPEWSVAMPTTTYIGNTQMLLKYLYEVERRNRLSIPIRACGVDAIALEQAKLSGSKSTNGKIVFPIDVGEADTVPTYEVLDIKGELYLSCVSEAVNPEYLSSIIMEATAAIKNNGRYVYEICGYRKLAGEANSISTLIYTLKLNTYEMSYLCSYMDKENISTTYYPDRIVFEAV